MKAQELYQKKFIANAKYWLKELDFYGENQFKKQTEVSDWTIGQVYQHVVIDAFKMHLKGMQKCLDKKDGGNGGKTASGIFFFLFGTFGPRKIKGPTGYTPIQPESVEKMKDVMFGYIKEMSRIAQELDKNGYDANYKVKHAVFGMLNAYEWYNTIILHQLHHVKQKKKIDKILRTFRKEEEFENPAPIV